MGANGFGIVRRGVVYVTATLLEELFDDLRVEVEPFALCTVAAGWRLRLTPAERPTLHFVLRGTGYLESDGLSSEALAVDSLVLVPPGRPHSIRNGRVVVQETVASPGAVDDAELVELTAGPSGSEGIVLACAWVDALYAGSLGLFDLLDGVAVLERSRSREVRTVFRRMLDESRQPGFASRAMLSALMRECLVLVVRALCETPEPEPPWLRALATPRLRPAIESVLAQPGDAHSLASLAQLAGMSRSAFARDFAKSLGVAPMAFVREVRLQRAMQLLRSTDQTVTAIAHQVGFSSRAHFSQAFTQRLGRSPSAYRTEHRPRPVEEKPDIPPRALTQGSHNLAIRTTLHRPAP